MKMSRKKPLAPRKAPQQARSKRMVEWILQGATRVFRAEGFGATTNRIAEQAGVSVGTLYEYFPNKEALLAALAERHVAEAEGGVDAALAHARTTRELFTALQAAVLASQRYPSQALDWVAQPEVAHTLRARVSALRERILACLCEHARASGLPDPELRARVVFGLIAELGSLTAFEAYSPEEHARLAEQLLELAIAHCAQA